MTRGTVSTGNQLIDTKLSRIRIASGGSVGVDITYSADKAGQSIQISHDSGFSVNPLKLPVLRGKGRVVQASLVVRRTSSARSSVLLTFTLGESTKSEVLKVSP
jgi:hypothetical protein